MATLTVAAITRTGIDPTFVSANGGGDEFSNDGQTFLVIKNGGGGNVIATFVTVTTVDGQAVADRTVTIGNGTEKWVGPFQKTFYNNSDQRVAVTYDGVTSVTVSALRLVAV